jgi:MFS family permease
VRLPDLGAPFWRLWTSSTISAAGDGLTFVALPLLAARLTTDPAQVALVQAAEHSSWLLLGLVSGALADRWDRLRIMAVTDLVRSVLFGAFAVAVVGGYVTLPLLAVFAFLAGVFGVMNLNAASAFLPAVVRRDRLETANSWLQVGMTVPSTMIGPPLGGVLFVAAVSLPFTVDAVSFLVSGLIVLSLRSRVQRVPRTEAPPPLRSALVEGVRYLWDSSVLRTLCLLLAVFNGVSAAVMGVLVLFATETLGLSERGYGVLLVVFAVGGLAGMAAVSRVRTLLGTSGVVVMVLGVQAVAMLATGFAPSVPVLAASSALAGATSGMWNVATISLRQRIVPDALLGRVTSAYRLVAFAAMPVGAALGGLLARAYGLPAPFRLAGVLLAGCALAALRWLPPAAIAAAEAGAPAHDEDVPADPSDAVPARPDLATPDG